MYLLYCRTLLCDSLMCRCCHAEKETLPLRIDSLPEAAKRRLPTDESMTALHILWRRPLLSSTLHLIDTGCRDGTVT